MKSSTQVLILSAAALLLVGGLWPLAAEDGITIRNTGPIIPYRATTVDEGSTDPSARLNTGNILNNHYYPALTFYAHANYQHAKQEIDYVIERPQYIDNNPRFAQILSVAYFIRGSIYFRHASGSGRLGLAKTDFEQSVKLNPANYLARLELARLVATLNQKDEAISMLDELLKAQLTANLRQEAQTDLQSLKSGTFKAVTGE